MAGESGWVDLRVGFRTRSIIYVCLLIAITFHEFSHAMMANRPN